MLTLPDPCLTDRSSLVTVLLELPFTVVEWANLASLEPTTDAMKVEGMIADTPSDGALLRGGRRLIGLTFNAEIHYVIAADGTIVHHNVPGPEGDGRPFLHLKAFVTTGYGLRRRGGHLRIVDVIIVRLHIDIVHIISVFGHLITGWGGYSMKERGVQGELQWIQSNELKNTEMVRFEPHTGKWQTKGLTYREIAF